MEHEHVHWKRRVGLSYYPGTDNWIWHAALLACREAPQIPPVHMSFVHIILNTIVTGSN
jgi:hypothetical protein